MPTPIPPPRESGTTTSTRVPLYWCRYGPAGAPPLLVLHGGPGAHHDYLLPQMLRLASSHDVLLYDQRGGGRSRTATGTVSESVTWSTHVEDLGCVISEFGLEPATVVAYSWGALLAMLFAIEKRSGLARVALLDPAPVSRRFRQAFEEEFSRRLASPAITGLREELERSGLRTTDPAAYRQRVFELSVAPYFADPARAGELTPFRVMGRIQESVWASLGDYDLVPRLGSLHLPSLVVHGRDDPIPLASSEAAAAALGAELVVLESCGHVPYVEQPEALFSALESFLAVHHLRTPERIEAQSA